MSSETQRSLTERLATHPLVPDFGPKRVRVDALFEAAARV